MWNQLHGHSLCFVVVNILRRTEASSVITSLYIIFLSLDSSDIPVSLFYSIRPFFPLNSFTFLPLTPVSVFASSTGTSPPLTYVEGDGILLTHYESCHMFNSSVR